MTPVLGSISASARMMLDSMGFNTFVILGAVSLASVFFACWLPETKGVLLEHMDPWGPNEPYKFLGS